MVVAGAPLRIAGYAGMGIADSFRVASRQAHTDPSGIRIRGGRRQSHSKAPADAASGGLCSNQLIFPPENGRSSGLNSTHEEDMIRRFDLTCCVFLSQISERATYPRPSSHILSLLHLHLSGLFLRPGMATRSGRSNPPISTNLIAITIVLSSRIISHTASPSAAVRHLKWNHSPDLPHRGCRSASKKG